MKICNPSCPLYIGKKKVTAWTTNQNKLPSVQWRNKQSNSPVGCRIRKRYNLLERIHWHRCQRWSRNRSGLLPEFTFLAGAGINILGSGRSRSQRQGLCRSQSKF